MSNDRCTVCGVPADHGYIIEPNHFEEKYVTEVNGYNKSYSYGIYTHFTVYATTDNNFFLPSEMCMEVLEDSGHDLCDDIPIDEPLVEVKVIDGKCQYCIAREQQLKLF